MSEQPYPVRLVAKHVADARQHGCHYAEGTCGECAEIASGVIERLAAAGFVIVPREPTVPMLAAAAQAQRHGEDIWLAMIAAALSPATVACREDSAAEDR